MNYWLEKVNVWVCIIVILGCLVGIATCEALPAGAAPIPPATAGVVNTLTSGSFPLYSQMGQY